MWGLVTRHTSNFILGAIPKVLEIIGKTRLGCVNKGGGGVLTLSLTP